MPAAIAVTVNQTSHVSAQLLWFIKAHTVNVCNNSARHFMSIVQQHRGVQCDQA